MPKQKDRYFPMVGRGLQTTGGDRSEQPDEWAVLQDVEAEGGNLEARMGRVLLQHIANPTSIMAFDGTNDRVDFPTALALGTLLGLKWTIEILFKSTSVAASRVIIGKFDATAVGLVVTHTSSSTVTVAIRDSAGNTTTLTHSGVAAGTLCGLQVTRDGATLRSYLNGDVQTGTMNATNLLDVGQISGGTTNGASWHLGSIGKFVGWSVVRDTQEDLYERRINPRHKDCLWDYVFEDSTAHDIIDRGAAQMHAQTLGSPAFNATALANNAMPIQGLGYARRKNGTRELDIIAGGTAYAATVT